MSEPTTRSPRTRFYLACSAGGALAMIVFAWFALEGRPDLFPHGFETNFYEVQARSLLHGHWDVPANALSFERFKFGGRFYTYFGPGPAILRMPVVLFTHSFDGRLSRVSMILAFAVLLTFVARLTWQVRALVIGERPLTRRSLIAGGAFVFVAGCGSTALFLGGFTWVYHEAVLWGIAWAMASYSFLLTYLLAPSRRALVLASLTATLAYLSRGTVGAGPVIALGLVFAARITRWAWESWRARRDPDREAAPAPWLRWLGLGSDPEHRSIWAVALATAVPLVLYAYVNYAKFGTFFGAPPYSHQDILAKRPTRQAALASGNGNLFGLKYAPTNLVQYFRPDAISFDRLFPWVTFSRPPHVFGHVAFDQIDFSASIPATSTLLFVLAVIGIVVVVRSRGAEGHVVGAEVLRGPLIGAAIGCVGTVLIAFLANRYEGDFVPILILAGAVGLWRLPRLLESRATVTRVVVGAVVVILGVWSCWATASLTLLHQRAYGQDVQPPALARLINFQLAVHERIPGGAPSRVGHTAALPLPAPATQESLLVVGGCAGLYWSSGQAWYPVEQTPATGLFHLQVRFALAPVGARAPLLSATDPRGSSIVWAVHAPGDRIRFEYEWTGAPRVVTTSAASIPARGAAGLTIRLDPALRYFDVRYHGSLLVAIFPPVAQAPATIGRQRAASDGAAAFAGSIRALATPTPVCARLAREDPTLVRAAAGP